MGWSSLSREDRSHIEEKPWDLVEPVKVLVETAMRRLKQEGTIDDASKTRSLYLEVRRGVRRQLYALVETGIDAWSLSEGKKREESLMDGLFVYTMEVVEYHGREVPLEIPDALPLPRMGQHVAVERISHLAGIAPERLEKATQNVEAASPIPAERWEAFVEKAQEIS